ncbi:Rad17 cell cycle checkpoint protein-domain-containing protein [Peziza echinospora]|nr:Rad17 cell cycle checkpoint protein-domain-containing protein [Peziza echinospora]
MPPPRKRLRRLASVEEESPSQQTIDDDGDNVNSELEEERCGGGGGGAKGGLRKSKRTTRSMASGTRGAESTSRGDTGNEDAISRRTLIVTQSRGASDRNGVLAQSITDIKGNSKSKITGKRPTTKKPPSSSIADTGLPLSNAPAKNLKPISSFFARASTVPVSSSAGTIRQTSVPPASQPPPVTRQPVVSKPISSSQPVISLEDLDDLIQDWNSDGIDEDEDEIMGITGTQALVDGGEKRVMALGNSGPQSKAESALGSLQHTFGSQQSSQPQMRPHPIFKSSQAPKQSIDTTGAQTEAILPWPMKHAPKSSNELAIHNRKVAEVATWLNNVQHGWSRKRILILKGPAGSGKSATLDVLCKEGGWEVVEWGNPSGGGGSANGWSNNNNNNFNDDTETWRSGGSGGEGFSSAFDDWLFRSGTWGCLDLVSSSGVAASESSMSSQLSNESVEGKNKLLLIEDLPNLSHQGTLLAFRAAIRAYLSLPSPPRGSPAPPIPPLVLIISEISEGAGSSTSMGMSVHRILGPQILSHPLVTEITFRKVAPTLLVKCMGEVLRREGFSGMFGKETLNVLAECGDLRGALGGLEMLLLGRNRQSVLESITAKKTSKRKKMISPAAGKDLLELLTPRFSTLGIFHSIGKVVYNKRYGDDPADPYYPSPPLPPPQMQSYHRYHKRQMKLNPNTILDDSGVDAGTFIYGIQENYLGGCNTLGGGGNKTLEQVLDDVCFCAEGLSDGDILMGASSYSGGGGDLGAGISRAGNWGGNSGYGGNNEGEGVLRQEEICAQIVVRCMALGLPSPVKRDDLVTGNGFSRNNGASAGGGWGSGGSKMYYPMGLRLWRSKEEIESGVEMWEGKVRDGSAGVGSNAGNDGPIAMAGLTRSELVLERLPYMANIARCQLAGDARSSSSKSGRGGKDGHGKSSTPPVFPMQSFIRSLEKITIFRGVGEPSEEGSDEGQGLDPNAGTVGGSEGEEAYQQQQRMLMPPPSSATRHTQQHQRTRDTNTNNHGGNDVLLNDAVESLVLADDDIEDPDDW